MNPLGCHAQVWVGDWTEESADLAARRTAEAGFDLLEVPVLDPRTVDPALTGRVLDRYGLQGACSMGLHLDADVSSEDADVAARGQELLLAALDVVRASGVRWFTGVLYSALHKYDRPLGPRGREHVVACLRTLAERAAADGVVVGLEVVNRYETNVVNTAQEALALLDDVGAENLVVHLDTYHMNIEEGDLAKPVLECGDRLGYVHVGGEPPRVPRIRDGRLPRLLPGAGADRLRRARDVRVVLLRRRLRALVHHAGRLAGPLGRQRGPRGPRPPLGRRRAARGGGLATVSRGR